MPRSDRTSARPTGLAPAPRIDRRRFLRGSAASGLGLGLGLGVSTPGWSAPNPEEARVRAYRPLGKTGLEISDIGYGSSRTTDPRIVRAALDRGVTYFDTAESYQDGASEESIGEALQGVREKVVLASKVKTSASTKKEAMMQALEGSLKRLRTDRIDVYLSHAVNDVDRMKNPEWPEFVALAKQQGKIRFSGVSGHGGELVPVLDYALDNGLVDVILCAYNFGQDPAFFQRFTASFDWIAVQTELPRIIDKAFAAGVGVVAMKTLRGARLNDMRPFEVGGATYAQAAFRWVLSNPKVSGLIVSMKTEQMVAEYVAASGGPKPSAAELDLLEGYLVAQQASGGYCNHGCNACESSCPEGLAISEILRTRMYATDYGDLGYAREEYAKLPNGASACRTCPSQACLGQCPQGRAVPSLMRETARLLA